MQSFRSYVFTLMFLGTAVIAYFSKWKQFFLTQLISLFEIKEQNETNSVLCRIFQLSLQSTPFSVHSICGVGINQSIEYTSKQMFEASTSCLGKSLMSAAAWTLYFKHPPQIKILGGQSRSHLSRSSCQANFTLNVQNVEVHHHAETHAVTHM